jgi:hypothetical protein
VVDSNLIVGRRLRIKLGADLDAAADGGDRVILGRNIRFTGVNLFHNRGVLYIFGKLDVGLRKETLDSVFVEGRAYISLRNRTTPSGRGTWWGCAEPCSEGS